MKMDQGIKRMNDYMRNIDRKAGPLTLQAGQNIAASTLTYQGRTVQVIVKSEQGNADVMVSMAVVANPQMGREAFYGQLLHWNNFQSGIGHFSLGDDEKTVFLICRRPIEGLDSEEFRTIVDGIVQTGGVAAQLIRQQFGALV